MAHIRVGDGCHRILPLRRSPAPCLVVRVGDGPAPLGQRPAPAENLLLPSQHGLFHKL